MTTKKSKKQVNKETIKSQSKKPAPKKKKFWSRFKRDFSKLSQRRQNFLARRPHRSFRLTKRRDYRRQLKLPGYWSFTKQVFTMLWKNKKTFFALVLVFTSLAFLLSNAMSQNTYQQLKDAMNEMKDNGFNGFFTTIGIFSGVVINYTTGSSATSPSQQAANVLIGLFAWLSAVWLVRAISAGQKPKMRDGLYSSGSPVIALMVLILVLLIQLIPAAAAVIIYGALSASGMLSQTIILMLAGGASILVITLSAFWILSTLFAMIIVTLPGMYPFRALRLAGDIVTGRRVRILFRLSWGFVIIALMWVVVLMPTIMIDGALKSALPVLDWMPIVSVVGLMLVYITIVIIAAYVYTFYRKVVESDSKPTKS